MPAATIWTAASCPHNPGAGAYAVTVKLPNGSTTTKSNGRRCTTPHRMELYAAIRGLSLLEPSQSVTIRTSSKYLVNGLNARARFSNTDLWDRLSELVSQHSSVRATWCRPGTCQTHDLTRSQAEYTSTKPQRKADTGYENNSGFRG